MVSLDLGVFAVRFWANFSTALCGVV